MPSQDLLRGGKTFEKGKPSPNIFVYTFILRPTAWLKSYFEVFLSLNVEPVVVFTEQYNTIFSVIIKLCVYHVITFEIVVWCRAFILIT